MHSTQLHSRAPQPRRPRATYYVLPMYVYVLARRAVRDGDPACAARARLPTRLQDGPPARAAGHS